MTMKTTITNLRPPSRPPEGSIVGDHVFPEFPVCVPSVLVEHILHAAFSFISSCVCYVRL